MSHEALFFHVLLAKERQYSVWTHPHSSVMVKLFFVDMHLLFWCVCGHVGSLSGSLQTWWCHICSIKLENFHFEKNINFDLADTKFCQQQLTREKLTKILLGEITTLLFKWSQQMSISVDKQGTQRVHFITFFCTRYTQWSFFPCFLLQSSVCSPQLSWNSASSVKPSRLRFYYNKNNYYSLSQLALNFHYIEATGWRAITCLLIKFI